MSDDTTTSPGPVPQVDTDPDLGEAAGGTDAVLQPHIVDPVTPDPPISAQVDEEQVPDEIQEPESDSPDEEEDSGSPEAPSEPPG